MTFCWSGLGQQEPWDGGGKTDPKDAGRAARQEGDADSEELEQSLGREGMRPIAEVWHTIIRWRQNGGSIGIGDCGSSVPKLGNG